MRHVIITLASVLPTFAAVLPVSAAEYIGTWSMDPAHCESGGDFLANGQTLIVESARLRTKGLRCELMNVLGTSRDEIDLSCKGSGRGEHRRVLKFNADHKYLVISTVVGKAAAVYHRCGRPSTSNWGKGAHAAAARLEDQGERLLSLGNYGQAEIMFTRAVKADPDYASAFNNRGFAKRLQGRYAEAIKDYDEAIRLEPATGIYFSNRGVAYDALGKLQIALADFDRAVMLDPKSPMALNGRGSVLRQLGQTDRAIVDLEKAIHANPGYVVALNNLAVAYRDKGNRSRASRLFERVLAIDPSNSFALKEKPAI